MNDADSTITTTCANCGNGEESSGYLKACTACKLVKYCNRECQIAHRPLHKKACKKRAAELHDEALFKEHPPTDDCPICLLPLSLIASQAVFKSCCGKVICNGCIYAMREEARERGKIGLCAFCRELAPTGSNSEEEEIKRVTKLVEADNSEAFHQLAGHYSDGSYGMQQDFAKANELLLRAGELGCAKAYCNLGTAYYNGMGLDVDKKKAKHYYELAAMGGNIQARYNLGCVEEKAGDYHQAMKHYILAAKAGFKESLDAVKRGFVDGFVTKDEYANTLRAYQSRQDEMKSDNRNKADMFRQRRAAA